MKNRTVIEIYCALVCGLSLMFLIYCIGIFLTNTYYYLNPNVGLHPSYHLQAEEIGSFKLPQLPNGASWPEETPEDIQIKKDKFHNENLKHVQYEAAFELRKSFIYILLLSLSLFGHLKLAKRLDAKDT